MKITIITKDGEVTVSNFKSIRISDIPKNIKSLPCVLVNAGIPGIIGPNLEVDLAAEMREQHRKAKCIATADAEMENKWK
jgi:hypothetical protein